MYSWASHWFSVLAEPGRVITGVLFLGVVLLWTPWARLGRWLATLGLVMLMAVAVLPIGGVMIAALEDRFSAPQSMPPKVDGIVVLGGATQPSLVRARGQIALNDNAERLIEFAALARRYPNAVLVFTGGGKSSNPNLPTEASVAREVLAAAGLDTTRVLFDDSASNTYENAVLAAALVNPAPGQTWLLVTSAAHMPRAVGSFRAAGWDVVPYPVDYDTGGAGGFDMGFNPTGRLQSLSEAMHEWAGLITYRVLGRTDSLFPAP